MSKIMKILALLFTALTMVFVNIYQFHKIGFILAMGITFATFSYHFLMRLAVGTVVNCIVQNRMDYTKWWFRPRSFEKRVYDFLKVKKWKRYVPTYDPDTFSIEKHSLKEIVQATCQSEVVHEIIFVFSFLPILFSIPFGEFFIFLITSILAALFDLTFVILQRYNRPRILSLMERK